jgi:hypothetical protein
MLFTLYVLDTVVIYNLYKTYNIQGLSQFRLCTADYALVTSRLLRQSRHLISRTHDHRQV